MRRLHPLLGLGLLTGGLIAAGAWAQTTATPTPAVTPLPIAPAAASTAPALKDAAPVPALPPVEPTPVVVAPVKAASPAPVAAKDDADDTPPPPAVPLKRPRFASAILQATDKITAETLRFEAKVGENLRYKGLIVTLRACETTASDEEASDSVANVEVLSQPQGIAGGEPVPARSVFKGWMFASSPSLHAFEHPLYDLWLISCRTSAPVGAPAAPPPAPARKVSASKPEATPAKA